MSNDLVRPLGARFGRARVVAPAANNQIGPRGVAAMQRMSSVMTAKNTTHIEEPRLPAPLVYRDEANQDRWLVEPPAEVEDGEPAAFTGPNACHAALEFAHRTYGCARYLASTGM